MTISTDKLRIEQHPGWALIQINRPHKRSPALPDVPSAAEVGLPRMDIKFWIGFAAPAGTPQAAIDKLNQSIIATLRLPASQQRLEQMGLETIGNTPAEATCLVDQQMSRWAEVIKQRGIKVD